MTNERFFTSVNFSSQSGQAIDKCELQYIMQLQMTTLIVQTFGYNQEIIYVQRKRHGNRQLSQFSVHKLI